MVLLHKLGVGAAALAGVAVVVAVAVGTELPRPADDPPKAARSDLVPVAAPVKEPEWKVEFRKAYGLKQGEFARRVAPPYPACRAAYFRDWTIESFRQRKMDPPEEALNKDYTDWFIKFGWKDGWTVGGPFDMGTVKPEEGGPLAYVLSVSTGFNRARMNAYDELLETKVTGDWVVRAGADPEKVVAALDAILRTECGLKVSLAVKEVEHDVYVLSGKYTAKPLADRGKNDIEVYAVHLEDRGNNRGGGGGDLTAMADHVEGWLGFPIVVGNVEGLPEHVRWLFNERWPATDEQRAEDKDPDAVLKNVAAQTGLTAKKEKQKIKVLVVTKDKP